MTYVEAYPSGQGNVPTGWIGVRTRLYNSSGDLKASKGYEYSSSPCVGMSLLTQPPYSGAHDAYYSYGLTRAWNGYGYSTYGSFRSPNQNW